MFLTLFGIVICLPPQLIVANAIKLDDRGHILFVQERLGTDRSKIRAQKSRTLAQNDMVGFDNIKGAENDPRV